MRVLSTFAGATETHCPRRWYTVLLLVSLQMITALRPLLGRADTFPPEKKLFFLPHWGKKLTGETE